ncbi:hypothetical protein E2C01_010542 [Portunus trituberculatus]|uniref:Uncharacterized protein n=1 Tax=Portunus trituberculatus TaxID=210409 RepID=A0A5B7D8N5_PORTR|nr:hypothetical protein [Portunus trituberculatus]
MTEDRHAPPQAAPRGPPVSARQGRRQLLLPPADRWLESDTSNALSQDRSGDIVAGQWCRGRRVRRMDVRKQGNFLTRIDTLTHKNKLSRDEDEEDPAKQQAAARRSHPKEMSDAVKVIPRTTLRTEQSMRR